MAIENIGLYPITIDVYKKHKETTVQANDNDSNGRGLLITLVKDGVPFNSTGINLKIGFRNAVGEERLYDCDTVNASEGKYKVFYPTEMLQGNGGRVVKLEIKAFEASGALLNYAPVFVSVSASEIPNDSIGGGNELSTLVNALSQVQGIDNRFGEVNAQLADIMEKEIDVVGEYGFDNMAIELALADAKEGDVLFFRPNTVITFSNFVEVNKRVHIKGHGAIFKFSPDYDHLSDSQNMFLITANNVKFEGGYFDGTGTPYKTKNNRFVWFTGKKGGIKECEFQSLPGGGSNFNGAVGFSITADEGVVSNCRFDDCPGAVFSQGKRTRIINCIATQPKDVSFALNSPNCIGSTIIGCKVFANDIVTSIHIGVEEGATDYIISSNYIYGIKDGIGIGCINVAVFTISSGGIISDNIIDSGGFVSTRPSAHIKVSEYYSNVYVKGNILRTAVKGHSSNAVISVSAFNNIIEGNRIEYGDTTTGFCIYVVPAKGTLEIRNNNIKSRATGSIIRVASGDNDGKPLISTGNIYSTANEGINITQPTNMPLYCENDNFEGNVTNPINGTAWQGFFNSQRTYKFPHRIREGKVLYGNAMPTSGTWNRGDTIMNNAVSQTGTAGSRYVIIGWIRITNGEGNVLNTDWLEMRVSTGN